MGYSGGQVGTRVLFEDDHVRVWLLELSAGQASDWHTHVCDYVYVVTRPGDTETEYISGKVDTQHDEVGKTVYRAADQRHRLKNNGSTAYQNIVIEFLDRTL